MSRKPKHGQSNSKIYNIWANMLHRCNNPNNKRYKDYGGRNIKVCKRWQGKYGFENFYEDIGKYKTKGMTLDRKDNNDGYYPENCRWVTRQTQSRNMRGKGYRWGKKTKKWEARITVNYKQIHLGCFDTEEEARKAYLKAKRKHHGIKHSEVL